MRRLAIVALAAVPTLVASCLNHHCDCAGPGIGIIVWTAAPVFVRPDSPLKPFAGRVLARDKISLAALDHGFYYDDASLPVVVAPIRAIGREWRYVIADRAVVAGSAYAAADRSARPDDPRGEAWAFAADVAARLSAPERVYVLDVCEADGRLWLLELNPFSGADLYACRADDVVAAVTRVADPSP